MLSTGILMVQNRTEYSASSLHVSVWVCVCVLGKFNNYCKLFSINFSAHRKRERISPLMLADTVLWMSHRSWETIQNMWLKWTCFFHFPHVFLLCFVSFCLLPYSLNTIQWQNALYSMYMTWKKKWRKKGRWRKVFVERY